MKKIIFLCLLLLFNIACKKSNSNISEPIFQNRVLIGIEDTSSPGRIIPKDTIPNNTCYVGAEVETELKSGDIYIYIFGITSKDTLYRDNLKGVSGHNFRFHNFKFVAAPYVAVGYALNPDTIPLQEQRFIIRIP